jgi:hypothetical protein
MPGFVDVSNMTSEEVRRMGHADDYDEPDTWKPRNHPSSVHQVGYAVGDVWAAACAAQRHNGSYLKESKPVLDAEEPGRVVSVQLRNRDIMMQFLQNPEQLTVDDVEAGEELRRWLQNDLTFRALKDQLTDFDRAAQQCLAVQDRFYTVAHRYEMAIVASLPNSHAKAKARETTQDRLADTTGEFVGTVGTKIQLNVEVIRTMFSKNWNVNFATAITSDNRAVFFSHKKPLTVGEHYTIIGTVKAHKDGQTQLNRVSFI